MANFFHKLGPERTEPVQSGRWERMRSHEKVGEKFILTLEVLFSVFMLAIAVTSTFCIFFCFFLVGVTC